MSDKSTMADQVIMEKPHSDVDFRAIVFPPTNEKASASFNAAAFADTLRAEAKTEMHDNTLRGPLLDTYSTLNSSQLKSVATELEKGNSSYGAAPQADVIRNKGEVKSITFTPGYLDLSGNEHSLTLRNHGQLIEFVKRGESFVTMSGKEISDPSGKEAEAIAAKAVRESSLPTFDASNALTSFTESAAGAAVGRFVSIPNRGIAMSGNFLKGMALGSGIEVAELGLAASLKDRAPTLAAFLKPSAAEAVVVGAAAAIYSPNMRMRAGLIAGAWLVGKAANIGEILLPKPVDK